MPNEYYQSTGVPQTGAFGASAPVRNQYSLIEAGFNKLPELSGNGGKAVIIRGDASALSVTTGTLALAGNFATTGAFNTTIVQGASVAITLPVVSGTLATLAGTETLTNKTMVAPSLGTPVVLVGTNITGTAAGLTAGNVTTNANLGGPISSVGNTTSITAQTGTGTTFVVQTSPTLITPDLGTPSALVGTNITGTALGLTAGAALSAPSANLSGVISSVGSVTSITSQTGTGTTFVVATAPTITGAVLTGITSLGIRSTGAAFDLTLASTEAIAAGRTLSIVVNDANRTLTVAGNATISGTTSGTNTGDQTTISGNAGTATALQTARAIYGNNFDGTAALTQIIASTYGGTGNGFTKFSGPASTEKTFTLPNATATILTSNAAVTVAQGGTGLASATAYAVLCGGTTSTAAFQSIASVGTAGLVLTSNGAGALPTMQAGGLTLLSTATASNSASLDFTSLITSAYNIYVFELIQVVLATGSQVLRIQTSTNNGSAYSTGSSDYFTQVVTANATSVATTQPNSAGIDLGTTAITTHTEPGISGRVTLYGPANATTFKHFVYLLGEGASPYWCSGTGFNGAVTTDIDAVRFISSSGNITSGTIRLYGVKTT